MSGTRYSRNEGLFGAEGQRLIGATRVAIVGLGGLGSHVAQQLAYLGVKELTLIDDDHVTESSLNRLIGAIESDIPVRVAKVRVAERMVKAIKPTATVHPLEMQLASDASRSALASADVCSGPLMGTLRAWRSPSFVPVPRSRCSTWPATLRDSIRSTLVTAGASSWQEATDASCAAGCLSKQTSRAKAKAERSVRSARGSTASALRRSSALGRWWCP
jgi:hypothetical protein